MEFVRDYLSIKQQATPSLNKIYFTFKEYVEDSYYLLGLFNAKVTQSFLSILNPSISLQAGDFEKLPILENGNRSMAELIAKNCVEMSKDEWDSFESSMDYKAHPFARLSKDLWDATAVGASMHYYSYFAA